MQQISTLEGFTERRPDVILITILTGIGRFRRDRSRSHGQFGTLRRPLKNMHSVPQAFRPKLNRG
ncbi:hypothetical protein CUJ84_Chr004381 [Rhizobium leguminosarum]|uniref:Uncharacterized protein n=1 Tax=Rhizobium leguminosarum TaxID=384 RepID=A0A2K9Z8V1_RHILE|nr:hypothetical protein CUJ84_Chr004381 [Rhizobium leguminosarum]